jgi:exopolyphosphatase/guanosine-5'-triphosphate,3'-diphosphate pyrophosphatase
VTTSSPDVSCISADGAGRIGFDMRVGVIDVGSNTLRLLVAEDTRDGLRSVRERRARVGLGADVELHGRISRAKLAETAESVRAFAAEARELGCSQLEIVVASPGRQAANAGRLIHTLARSTAAPVRVLSREEEARLAYVGAITAARPDVASVAVCDVGGGSTQIAFGTPVLGPLWSRSVDLGSLRLTARLLADAGDPPSAEAVEAARGAAAEAFTAVVPPVAQLALAAGGTARALRRVVDVLDADGLAAAVVELSALKRAKISKRYSVPPQRAATLLAGTILFAEVQKRLGLPLALAGGGLREGSAITLFREGAAAYA